MESAQPTTVAPLPAGHHGLSREQVAASQRSRLLDAIIEEVGANGLTATTVADVTARARVSRSAFYSQFADKSDAFRVAYTELTELLIGELVKIGLEAPTFLRAVSTSVETYLAWCAGRPNAARAWHLAVMALEPDGFAVRDAAIERIEALFRAGATRARREHRGLPEAKDFLFYGATQATLGLVSREIRADRIAELPLLAPSIEYLWLTALADTALAEASQAKSR